MLRPRRFLGYSFASLAIGIVFVIGASGAPAATGLAVSHPVAHILKTKIVADSMVQSSNWAGYDEGLLDTSKLAQSISAEWTVPTASQHTAGQAESAADWIGIGGGCVDTTGGCLVTDETLIQAGTEEDVSASGQASYSAWWEVLPAPSLTSSVAVHPGDVVKVSISQVVPEVWTIAFNDLTDGQSFTQDVPYPSPMDTAEWIEEAPVVVSTSSAGEATLPNLTSPNFTAATLNGSNPGLSTKYAMQMVSSSGQVLATPSAPSGGDAFSVCTYSASC
jgi:hypothetical protein